MKQELTTAFTLKSQQKPTYIIPELIPRHSLSVLYGKPKGGKTFLALKWALELATNGTPVLYVAGEGLGNYGARLKAWEHINVPIENDTPLLFTQRNINLNVGASVGVLIDLVNQHEFLQDEAVVYEIDDEGEEVGHGIPFVKPVGLIIIDTFSRALAGGDENDAGAVSAAIEQLDRLRNETGAAVLVVHHTTKDSSDDENARERGSSALRGAADVMIHLSSRKKTLAVTAARDFESGAKWNFVIEKSLESAVIKLEAAVEEDEDKLGEAQQVVYDALLLGHRSLQALIDETSMTKGHVWAVLNKLIDKGIVEKQGRGIYAPIGQGIDIAEPTP